MSEQLIIDYARELGLPMRGRDNSRHVGWTTDRAKAETMRGVQYERVIETEDGETTTVIASVHVESVPCLARDKDARKFDGWEISFPVGAKVLP